MIDWLIILLPLGTMSIVEQKTSAIKVCNYYDGKGPFCISLQRSLSAQYFQLDISTATFHHAMSNMPGLRSSVLLRHEHAIPRRLFRELPCGREN
jgi:hypothetical protein